MNNGENKIVYQELSYKINGILFKARKIAGLYRNEKQYCDVIENLLKKEKIPYEREKFLPVSLEGEALNRNRVDFLIDDKIILEIKSKSFITDKDYYQMMRYLISLRKKLGILVNMRHYSIKPHRILNSSVESE